MSLLADLLPTLRQRRRDAGGPARRRALPRGGARPRTRGREAPPRVRDRTCVRARGSRGVGLSALADRQRDEGRTALAAGGHREHHPLRAVTGHVRSLGRVRRSCSGSTPSGTPRFERESGRRLPTGASVSSGMEDSGGGHHLDAVLFSAKEAIFKAWYPLTRGAGSGSATRSSRSRPPARSPLDCWSRNQRSPERRSRELAGRWAADADVVVTAVLVPSPPEPGIA